MFLVLGVSGLPLFSRCQGTLALVGGPIQMIFVHFSDLSFEQVCLKSVLSPKYR